MTETREVTEMVDQGRTIVRKQELTEQIGKLLCELDQCPKLQAQDPSLARYYAHTRTWLELFGCWPQPDAVLHRDHLFELIAELLVKLDDRELQVIERIAMNLSFRPSPST